MKVVERVDVARLRRSLALVPAESWTQPSRFADTKVHHGYRRVSLVNGGRAMHGSAAFQWLLEQYEPVRTAWLSQLDPGGFIIPHRDGGPYLERWHIPIHAAGVIDDLEPQDGVPFRVEHWNIHSLWNPTDRPRIHLVIDRDVTVNQPAAGFESYPVPPERAELVARAT